MIIIVTAVFKFQAQPWIRLLSLYYYIKMGKVFHRLTNHHTIIIIILAPFEPLSLTMDAIIISLLLQQYWVLFTYEHLDV